MMTIEPVPYSNDYEKQWDDWVKSANNGTIFHLRAFLNYHPADRFRDASIIFMYRNRILSLLPAAVHDIRGERVFYSHPGASYGGLVTSAEIGLETTREMVKRLIDSAREQGCSRICITLPPCYYHARYNSYVDFALQQANFTYLSRELSSVLPLADSAEAIYSSFPDGVKRAIRKAERRGIRVVRSQKIGEFYTILKNNLEMRHNVSPTHTAEELELLFTLFPGRIQLFAAELNGEQVGGIVTFGCNTRVNLAFYIAHNHAFQEYRPVDFLIWHVIQHSCEAGYRILDFGTFTLNMKPNLGLCRFKEKFGARGVFRDTLEREV